MTDPVFAIDRAILASRRALVALVKFHIATGFAVQIEDTHLTGDDQLRYEIRAVGDALQLLDAAGQQIGIFADIAELVAHAEWSAGTDWPTSSYDIALIATPQPFGGRRWRFRCPNGLGPCSVLCLPPGTDHFASRQAHGLAFASQRLRAPARAAVRAQRICLELGGSSDLNAPFPPKPKGMWSKSYERQLKGLSSASISREFAPYAK